MVSSKPSTSFENGLKLQKLGGKNLVAMFDLQTNAQKMQLQMENLLINFYGGGGVGKNVYSLPVCRDACKTSWYIRPNPEDQIKRKPDDQIYDKITEKKSD